MQKADEFDKDAFQPESNGLPLQLDDLFHQTADKSVVAVHELGKDAPAAENEGEDDQFSTALREKFSSKTSGDLSCDPNKLVQARRKR